MIGLRGFGGRLSRAATVGVLLVLPTACGLFEADRPAPLCPSVRIVKETGTLTRFAPGRGQDLTDVDFGAHFVDVLNRCDNIGDADDPGRKVVMVVAPVIAAQRGPANDSRVARLTYFVSVVDGSRSILSKEAFPTELVFPGNQTRVVVEDDDPLISVEIPLPEGRNPATYSVLLGFQLTPEELAYNRRRLTVR